MQPTTQTGYGTMSKKPETVAGSGKFTAELARKDFPILEQKIRGKKLIYLDNAATSQIPLAVLENLKHTYTAQYSNIHRGVHYLSQKTTDAYEAVRGKVRDFIHAAEEREIIFTGGTTDGINLVAQSYGRANLQLGDEVLISQMEHHSNIVPWQMVCQATGATLRVIPMTEQGELKVDSFKDLINPRTKIVSVVHVSNALGTVNPVEEIIEAAHRVGAICLVDGAQAVPHMPVDVQKLNCDFYTFSGHKMYGPSGTGVLYGRAELLEAMPPYQGGGDMILTVSFEKTTYNQIPFKFEAGTPNISGVIGLGAAIDYLQKWGLSALHDYEQELLRYGTAKLMAVPGVRLVGTAKNKSGVMSFVMDGVHPHDMGTILDEEGIAIRTGHHCAQPVMDFFGVPATARASLALYNTKDDLDALVAGLENVRRIFSR